MEDNEVTSTSTSAPVPMFTEPQEIALALTPVVTSFFSCIGSTLISYIIVKTRNSPKREKQKTYYHLVLAMSLADVIASLSFCTGTFLEPQEYGKWQAHGNQATCNLQGFLTQIGFMSPFYTCFLAMYFYLCICHKEPSSRASVQMEKIQKVEPYMLVLPFLMNLSFAITSLKLDLYNPTEFGVGCWISPIPFDCEEEEAVECVRGKHSSLFRSLFGAMWVFPIFIILFYCFGSIYWNLRKQLRDHEQHFRYESSELGLRFNAARNDLRQTGIQGLLYIMAFVAVYFWNFVARGMEMLRATNGYFAISMLSQIFSPAQGIFNFFIFVRPIYCECQRLHPHDSTREIWSRVFGHRDTARRGGMQRANGTKALHLSNISNSGMISVDTPGGNPQQPSIDLCLDLAADPPVPVLKGHGSTDTVKTTGDSSRPFSIPMATEDEEKQEEEHHEKEEEDDGNGGDKVGDDPEKRESAGRPFSV